MMNCLSKVLLNKFASDRNQGEKFFICCMTQCFLGTARNQFAQQLTSIFRVSCSKKNHFSHDESNFSTWNVRIPFQRNHEAHLTCFHHYWKAAITCCELSVVDNPISWIQIPGDYESVREGKWRNFHEFLIKLLFNLHSALCLLIFMLQHVAMWIKRDQKSLEFQMERKFG